MENLIYERRHNGNRSVKRKSRALALGRGLKSHLHLMHFITRRSKTPPYKTLRVHLEAAAERAALFFFRRALSAGTAQSTAARVNYARRGGPAREKCISGREMRRRRARRGIAQRFVSIEFGGEEGGWSIRSGTFNLNREIRFRE